jgi:4-alpha-glucanotransferase
MLVCGEDLGMVPDCVPWVMDQLQILSLEIQRMPKNPQHEFGHVEAYPYRSVCTISTHDMSTLRGWWQEDATVTDRFFHTVLGHDEPTPQEAPGWVCEEVVRRHLDSPSLLCVLSFQDWMSLDEQLRYPDAAAERINVPANPRHYWRYRMHLTLEALMRQEALNAHIRTLIDESARY